MTCANFQELEAGLGAANQLTISPIDFPFDNDTDLRLDIYNYQDEQWNNVPLDGGANLDVGGAGDVHYSWEIFDNNGQRAVRTLSVADGATAGSHPLVPANNNYPVESGTGVNVRLYRMTSIDRGDMPATFYPGSAVKAEDLNANFEALRKVVEESACSTNNVTDAAPLLDQRYWNKLDDTVESGEAWIADDAHIATTLAGDQRWLGGGAAPDVVGGPGVTITPNSPAAGQILVSADLEAAGAGEGGLVFDPNTGNTGEIRVNVGNGLELTANGVEVDLADPSGLEFTGGDLRIDANSGCEIVAAGLNAETTAASIVQTGGTDADPAIRVATTLGTTTTNTDLVINGGANVTVTRDNNGQLTISSSGGTGLTYRGTVDVTDDATLPTNSNVNDVFANDTQGTQTANWQTVITGASTTANVGDLLLCTTAAGGTATNARYTLIESGTPGGGTPNLQQVTTEGNTTTAGIITRRADATNAGVRVEDASNNPAILLFGNGVATFNEQGLASDFRVESDGQTHMLFVDGTNNRVGINEDVPTTTFHVDGQSTFTNDVNINTGASINLSNAGNTRTVSINADDATNNYTITLPAAQPAANGEVLSVLSGGGTADVELEWAAGGGAALWEANGGNLRPITNTQGVQLRNAANNTTLIGADGSATFNETGAAVDFRVEGDTDVNLLFVDGSEDRVGIGTNAPDSTLDVDGQVTITQNAITAGAGNFNLANGNFWTLGAVVIPNPTNMVAGMSGLIVNTAQATWPNAGGATFQYAANTPPNITEFPAVIPFYCTNNTTIFIGTPTVNIV